MSREKLYKEQLAFSLFQYQWRYKKKVVFFFWQLNKQEHNNVTQCCPGSKRLCMQFAAKRRCYKNAFGLVFTVVDPESRSHAFGNEDDPYSPSFPVWLFLLFCWLLPFNSKHFFFYPVSKSTCNKLHSNWVSNQQFKQTIHLAGNKERTHIHINECKSALLTPSLSAIRGSGYDLGYGPSSPPVVRLLSCDQGNKSDYAKLPICSHPIR